MCVFLCVELRGASFFPAHVLLFFFYCFECSASSSDDDSSLDSVARKKKQELKAAAANWVAPTSTGVTNSEAIVQYDDLKSGKIYTEMEVT